MSAYIMTDIHGHYDDMREMFEKIGFSADDRLICAGDYIDRGPKSYEMLRWTEAPGENVILVRGNQVLPLYVDHSALDSYMFYIRVSGKSILFTGDFREHGIVGQRGRLERVLKTYVPGPVGKASPDWGFHETSPVVSFRHGRNARPEDYVSPFEKLLDKFFDRDGQIIYSMWKGYLEEEHADWQLLRFIGGRPYESLHTSGHAYVETIAGLIGLVNPKIIIPIHTKSPEDFTSIPEFAPYRDRVQVLRDGIQLPL